MTKGVVLAVAFSWLCISASQAKAEPLVFIVSYHNVDYAKVACDQVLSLEPDAVKDSRQHQKYGWGEVGDATKYTLAAAAECKTVRDTRELGRRLENELIDALAVEPLCGGVTVIREPHSTWEKTAFFEVKCKFAAARSIRAAPNTKRVRLQTLSTGQGPSMAKSHL